MITSINNNSQLRVHSVIKVLELACAAARVNSGYTKESITTYIKSADSEDAVESIVTVIDNKSLIKISLSTPNSKNSLNVTDADVAHAQVIKKYFRKLIFSAMKGVDEFDSTVYGILSKELMTYSEVGFIAYLPIKYKKSLADDLIKKVDSGYLGNVDDIVLDLDAEIVGTIQSTAYPGYNITAIINNKLVSWFSSIKLQTGPAVLIKGKIKSLGSNWKTQADETRLTYVKVAQ